MAQVAVPFTVLSETQRAQALERLEIIRPAVEKKVSQAQVARTHNLPASTVPALGETLPRKRAGGACSISSLYKGKSRSLPDQVITLIEGLTLQTPPRSVAAIHRQIVEIAKDQGWKPPSYERIRQIIKTPIPPWRPLLIRTLPLTEKRLIYATGGRPLTPMPCGRLIIPHWM